MKECLSCGEAKDILDFYRIDDGDDSFQASCLMCRAEGFDARNLLDYEPED